ncbi:aromatic amino acid exporter YddG [Rehaibacterium terrae]|jgi:drug/metabolite transporter (DMT)-like permease|uniref:Drug/metabolite transporter (DMT)-like permease n=1 Tax=Rehaibacterium terrae TaxID=1341696 RepID=A0A7W7XZK4_9GAMM|nr:EamA family transporter [Rehaibacterium terrae]MBB5015322.1 drug/metabolite transporter (DMT)-like permease [Rehaibacterium terrae]
MLASPESDAMLTRAQATLCGVAAIALWSSLAVLTAGSGAIPPFQLLAMSFGVAGALGLVVLHRRGGIVPGLRQPRRAALLATAALFGYHALYFIALKNAPVVEANLINYLWPLLIVLFAALLPGERVRGGQLLGTLLGLAGAGLVVTRGQGLALDAAHAVGYFAALGAALTWAAYSVLNRRYAQVPSAAIVGPCIATAVLGAAAHLLFESTVQPTPPQWLAVLAMGLGPVGAAFWFWDVGTKRGDLALIGTLSYAAPLLSTAWLLLAGHARPHWTQAAAVALLIGGAALSIHASRRVAKPTQPA